MAKIDNRPKEKMRLTIEFADNGIILRNPDDEYDVTLVLSGENGYNVDHSEEYRIIGKKIYDWLTDVVVSDHSNHWIAIGADFDIVATLIGRKR